MLFKCRTNNYFNSNDEYVFKSTSSIFKSKVVFENGCWWTVESLQYKAHTIPCYNANNIKKCIISRYDETINEPPYLTIPIDSVEVTRPEIDNYGENFYNVLNKACKNKGYVFKFYTSSSENDIDYEIVVY